MIRMGFGKFWRATEIDNVIFQNLESFVTEKFFKITMEEFWIFVWKILKYPKTDITRCRINCRKFYVC